MNYNLADKTELKAARSRISYLAKKQKRVSVKEFNVQRSLSQNSYLHLLLADFGLHFGYTLEEAKLIYKEINRPLYYYGKKGRTFIRSSADLDKDEMAQSIDKFMQASAEQGYPLPPADNAEWRSLIENEIEKNKRYL